MKARLVKDFQHDGYHCLIFEMPVMRHLCGYVEIPKDHVCSGKEYDAIDFNVHGGLTFGGTLEDLDGYFLGFDCAHYGDLVPGMAYQTGVYRDEDFVTEELKKLVGQLKALT